MVVVSRPRCRGRWIALGAKQRQGTGGARTTTGAANRGIVFKSVLPGQESRPVGEPLPTFDQEGRAAPRPLSESPGLKILHLIAPAPAGGAESAVRSLAVGLQRQGRDVEVAALLPRVGEHPFPTQVASSGVRVHEIRRAHRNYLGQARSIVSLLREHGADVLHSHVAHADVLAYLATRRENVPWVSTVHGLTGHGLKNSFYQLLGIAALKRCRAVVCVAKNVEEDVVSRGVDPARVHLVPNGYVQGETLGRSGARAALGIPPSHRAIGWIGRLSHEKGADLLLEALARAEAVNVTAVVIGDGPEQDHLVRLAEALGLTQDRLRFAGRVNDAARYLPAFDLLALSSRTEGTPMVLLEAMAVGVPIVAFRVGGVPGVLRDESAFLVTPEDVPGFSEALREALGDPQEAQRRAAEARQAFDDRFSIDQCSERIGQIYDDVVAGRET